MQTYTNVKRSRLYKYAHAGSIPAGKIQAPSGSAPYYALSLILVPVNVLAAQYGTREGSIAKQRWPSLLQTRHAAVRRRCARFVLKVGHITTTCADEVSVGAR